MYDDIMSYPPHGGSEHLSLTVELSYDACLEGSTGTYGQPRVDWEEGRKSGALDVFASEVRETRATVSQGVR